MYHVGSERARWRVFSLLAGLAAFARFTAEAATVSITGVGEGSQIIFPASVSATNLSLTAMISGAVGTPEITWTLERQGTIFRSLTSSMPYAVTFSNLSAGKYFLTANVVGAPSASTDLSFDIRSASLQPANDLWIQAVSLPGAAIAATGTNTYATTEPGEPTHADNGGGRSLWWKWQAVSNGLVSITTDGSALDTVLAVYAGTNVANLAQIAANDDAGSTNQSSQVSFSAIAGMTYYIAVDGALSPHGFASSGSVRLQLLVAALPSVSLSFPTNGLSLFVPSALTSTNLSAVASISDPVGLRRVEYSLDGAGISRAGSLSPPYQWTLSNLLAGDYLLTVTAVNNAGLISAQHASFSIIPLSPEIQFVDSKPVAPSGFQFAVTGLKGMNYELQASTNILAWDRLTLWTNFDGAQRVTDTNAAQLSARFYRVIAP